MRTLARVSTAGYGALAHGAWRLKEGRMNREMNAGLGGERGEQARALMDKTWKGPVTLVQADTMVNPSTERYATVFVCFHGRVAVSWCAGDEHSFDARTGACIESSDGRMKGWRIAAWEMHRFNAMDAAKYLEAQETGGMSVYSSAAPAVGGGDQNAAKTTANTAGTSVTFIAADRLDEVISKHVREALVTHDKEREEKQAARVRETLRALTESSASSLFGSTVCDGQKLAAFLSLSRDEQRAAETYAASIVDPFDTNEKQRAYYAHRDAFVAGVLAAKSTMTKGFEPGVRIV